MSETTTTSQHDEYLQRRTFGALDGLRALSILAVLWHHAYEAPTGWAATERGFLGVDLFFVISGFLIVSLLLRERARRGDISLRNFYIRRFLRIFPLYYGVLGALALLFLVVGARVNMHDAFFAELPWALTYTSNWAELSTFLSITWSLSAEEQFYVVWPPLERLGGRVAITVLCVALVVGQVIHFGGFDGVFAAWGFAPGRPMMLRQTGFTPMLLGVLLAHALHSPRWWNRLAPLLRWRPLPVVVVVALVGVCSVPIADISGWPRLTVHLLMVVLVGSCVVREDHTLRPLLSSTPLVKVGVLSYGIYLLHMPVRIVMDAVLHKVNLLAPTSLFISTVVVTLVVAQLSYTLFESRFLKLKDRFNA